MANLDLYASVTEHDAAKRGELLEQLQRLGITPNTHNDTVEFVFSGGRDMVMKAVEYAESHTFHSVRLSVVK